jgi:hypothetical protein
MPAGNLVRIPTSLSRGGTTLTNLRGIVEGNKAVDYMGSKILATAEGILQVTTAFHTNSDAWTSSIRYAFEPVSEINTSYISYSKSLTDSTTVTILFRVLFNPVMNPFSPATIFQNGDTFSLIGGYSIVYLPYSESVAFFMSENSQSNFVGFALNSAPIETGKWYHYGIQVVTSEGNTVVEWWENGIQQAGCNLGWEFQTPQGGTTKLFNDANNYSLFYGKITDFVFLNGKTLNASEMSAFGSAPFV